MPNYVEKNSSKPGQSQPPAPEALLARLRSLVPTLSRGPAQVGRAVLADPQAIVPMTMRQLAAHTDTSDASVTRLAQAIGCTGYREFRALLAASTAVQTAAAGPAGTGRLPADIELDDAPAEVVAKLLAEEQQALADSAAALDIAALTASADAICAARRVVITGIGASGIVARDLSAKLERIGIISQPITEGHHALTAAAVMEPVDLLIVISASGETADMLEPLDAARAAGIPTVAITVRPRSRITAADHVLIAVAARESGMRPAAMSSRTGQLFIVDSLFALVYQRRAEQAGAAVTTSHQMLAPRRHRKDPS